MKLISLQVKHFKGLDQFRLDAEGRDVTIYGDNGAGKTTIKDAFLWLLFGKDSQNQADFSIKTLDSNGEPVHNLKHEVEAALELESGKRITLKKVYYEKWTKKRGSVTKTFTGHTTDHFIDAVPVQKNEYDTRIKEISDEEVFRLLTDPTFFNTEMHWQDRRRVLLDVCGDVSDVDVMEAHSDLSALSEILSKRSLEEHQKVVSAKKKEINRELDRIPVRIDEVTQGLPDIEGLDEKALTSRRTLLKKEIKEKERALARITAGGEIADKTKALREVEGELIRYQNEFNAATNKEIAQKRQELAEVQGQVQALSGDLAQRKRTLQWNGEIKKSLEDSLAELREQWKQIHGETFTFEQEEICPTCGQPLPEDRLKEARDKAVTAFNRNKAESLKTNNEKGKALVGDLKTCQTETDTLQAEIQALETSIAKEQGKVQTIEVQIKTLREEQDDPRTEPAYKALLETKETLEEEIRTLQTDRQKAATQVEQELVTLDTELSGLERDLSRIVQYQAGEKRILELEEKQKNLAEEYERLEEETFLMESFIQAKVAMLQEQINSKFKLATFKLFDVQVNGGIVECCETLHDGVPYSTNLNDGARLNVGLDIINTLSEDYGFTPPIFIDRAESVTEILPTRGQQILLEVSRTDKDLRIEFEKREAV